MSGHSSNNGKRVDQAIESFVERFRRGERPSIDEYVARHPDIAGELRDLLPALVLLEQNAPRDESASDSSAAKRLVVASFTNRTEIGDFSIVREIGRGGMGVVYEAIQRSLSRHVALKVLTAPGFFHPNHLERFQLEARAAARLHHTHIVPVFGVGEHGGLHFYAMQFIPGQSLDLVIEEVRRMRRAAKDELSTISAGNAFTQVIADGLLTGHFRATTNGGIEEMNSPAGTTTSRGTPWPQAPAIDDSPIASGQSEFSSSQSGWAFYRSVARVGMQVAEALAYAHGEGILHRDIKPSNLLLDVKGNVWITDFGLAKAEDGEGLTQTGDLVGTLRYMAPERFDGRSDSRSDVYGLGVTLYELVALRPLFKARGRGKLIQQILHEPPNALRKVDPRVPRDLETIVEKALAKEPKDRYASARQMADDLSLFLADRAICARRNTALERVWRWCRRNPALASLTAALLVVATVGFVAVTWKWRDAERARQNEELARQEAMQRAQEIRQGQERLKAASTLVDLGARFAEIHGWDDAEATLSQAINLCPELVSGWEKRADLYFRLGLFDLASSDYQQVYKRQEPAFARQWFRHAALRLRSGDLPGYYEVCDRMNANLSGTVHIDSAIDLVRTCVLGKQPYGDASHWVTVAEKLVDSRSNESLLYVLGCAYFRAGQFDRAARCCQGSLDLNPDLESRAINYPILAMAYHNLGQTDDALQALTNAALTREEWIAGAYPWTTLLTVDGGATDNWPVDQLDWLEFELHFREACALLGVPGPSDDARLRVLRARAFASLRHADQADAEYRIALQLRPEDLRIQLESHRNLAYHFQELGKYDTAATQLAKAIQIDAADYNLWQYLAVTQLASENIASYKNTCEAMFDRFGKVPDPHVLHNLVWTCTLHSDALADMARLLVAAEKGAQWWIDSERILVAAHYRLGQYNEAINALNRLSRVSRLQPTVLFFAAMTHHRLGEANEARRELAAAIAAMSTTPSGSTSPLLAPGVDPRNWADKVAEKLLRKEAEALILDSLPHIGAGKVPDAR